MEKTYQKIVTTVGDALGIDPVVIRGPGTSKEQTDARYICFKFIKENTGVSCKRIARFFGKKSHGTVLNGLHKFDNYMETDREFRIKVDRVITTNKQHKPRNGNNARGK